MPLLEYLDFDLVLVATEDLERVLDRFIDGGPECFGVLELDELFLTMTDATGRACAAARRRRARSAGRPRGRCARRRHASSQGWRSPVRRLWASWTARCASRRTVERRSGDW